jgi:uncharacterized membrane protein YbhN (UPF0104 family)
MPDAMNIVTRTVGKKIAWSRIGYATSLMATLLGFLSHAPGSLGVFEATLLVGLPQFEKEGLLVSLVMFRMLYFILPFALALLILGSRELALGVKAAATSRDCDRPEIRSP